MNISSVWAFVISLERTLAVEKRDEGKDKLVDSLVFCSLQIVDFYNNYSKILKPELFVILSSLFKEENRGRWTSLELLTVLYLE